MIQVRAKSLHQIIDKKRILRSEKIHIEAYKTRKQQLQTEVGKVVRLCQMINLMCKHNICNKDYEEEIQSIRSIGVRLQEQFSEKPEWLKEQGTLRPLSMKIESVTNQIEEDLIINWKEFIEKEFPSINDDMLSIMVKIPSFSIKVNQIQKLYREISEEKEIIPVQEKDLITVLKKKQELIQEWSSLGAEDVPLAVLTFIRSAASHQGALLQYLTPEVFAWLNQYNILSFFKIRLQ